MNSVPNKTESQLTGMWVTFFTTAGIPSDVAATYALTFTENRIQNDMLLDLNKEYLRDMGITRMGDVIAILRHAKQVHESAARDRVLSTAATSNKVPIAAVAGRTTTTQAKALSPASRMLEHYTRNTGTTEASSVMSPLKKRKSIDVGSETEIDVKKTRLIRFTAPTSSRTSSTAVVKEGLSKTVFTRLGYTDSVKSVPKNTVSNKPVFARLGAKADDKSVQETAIPMQKDALKYEGILKSTDPKRVFTVTTSSNNIRKIAVGTMRADEQPVSIKEKLALPKSKSVKFSNHVEYKEIEPNQDIRQVKAKVITPKLTTIFNKPERRLSMPEAFGESSGIKSRLGQKDTNNIKVKSNIFNRLGI